MKNYENLAKSIIEKVGGDTNVKSLTHCVTRLRFQLFDTEKAQTQMLKEQDGVVDVILNSGQYQVVIGQEVGDVYDAIMQRISLGNDVSANTEEKVSFVELLAGIFTPLLGLLCATGIIKGGSILFVGLGWITQASGTFQILQVIGDSMLYFTPIFLGYTSAKKFGMNEFVGMAIGTCLIHPTIVQSFTGGDSLYTLFSGSLFESNVKMTFLAIPVLLMNYTSSVIPIIFATFVGAKVEKVLKRITPTALKLFFIPAGTLLIVVPLALIIIGPIATWIAQVIGAITMEIYKISPVLTGVVVGGFWQVFVIFGLHHGLMPISLNNMTIYGFDCVLASRVVGSFATFGVLLAIYYKTRKKQMKTNVFPMLISSFFGVTEPAIYGLTLPLKKPFIMTCIAGGLSGGIVAFFGAKYYSQGGLGILSLPSFIGSTGLDMAFYGVVIAVVVAIVVGFALTWLFGYKEKLEKESFLAPIKGKVIPLRDVNDLAFANGGMGKGVAIIPEEGIVKAPLSGTIAMVFPTQHAIGLISDEGIEILIHVGMDTVKLEGEYFKALVKQNQHVTQGDILLEFDYLGIQEAGYSTITPVIITNTKNYASITIFEKGEVLMEIKQ